MLCDFHLHSRFSADSEADPWDILKKSEELSMPAFCITDHLDFDYPYEEDFELDLDGCYSFWRRIRETVSGELTHSPESSSGFAGRSNSPKNSSGFAGLTDPLKKFSGFTGLTDPLKKFSGFAGLTDPPKNSFGFGDSSSPSEGINLSGFSSSPEIFIGMETGLEPGYEGQLSEAVNRYPWDFIIGSTHLVHRRDPYFSSYYEGRTEEAAYREYFESILETLDFCSDFDVYGHIDYVVRYGPNKNRFYSYEKYADVLDAILRKLISMGKGIELNTGGYLKGLGVPNPAPEVIRRYRELGGEIITVGSDAHEAALVGHHFAEARDVLLDAGFRYYCIFKKRKPVFLPVS